MSTTINEKKAILDVLENNGYNVLTPEISEKISDMREEISELEKNPGNEERIEELEELIAEYDDYITLDDIEVTNYTHYELNQYEISKIGETYCVGTEDDMDYAMKEYTKSYIDDVGEERFLKNLNNLENYIDMDALKSDLYDSEYDYVSEDASEFFDDTQRELSSEQVEMIEILNNRIEKYRGILGKIPRRELEDKKEVEINDLISRLESKIEDIQESPEGDFPDELISDMAKSMVDDRLYNLSNFISEYGYNYIQHFIDMDDIISDIVDESTYEVLSHIDGNYYETRVDGEYYFVIKTED